MIVQVCRWSCEPTRNIRRVLVFGHLQREMYRERQFFVEGSPSACYLQRAARSSPAAHNDRKKIYEGFAVAFALVVIQISIRPIRYCEVSEVMPEAGFEELGRLRSELLAQRRYAVHLRRLGGGRGGEICATWRKGRERWKVESVERPAVPDPD